MRVLYELLASESAELKQQLEDVVVILNPCQNPDGRERFVSWYNAHGIGRPETFAFEKENPWNVQGRYNHYYFDLNRDMIAMSQVESRHSGAAFLEWLPQVAADHHGETKEYFFPPATLPINPNVPRETLDHWLDVFGRGNAAAFDEQSWMYYVRDYFDIFYAGYWDSWPALQGATGMTYETSGGGKLGRNHRRDDDTVMTLRAAIAKHFTASLATIATAAEHREARLRDFREHFVSAVRAGREGEMQQVFFPATGDLGRRDAMLQQLALSGVEIHQLREAATVEDARGYLNAESQEREFPAGTLVVDLAQPRGHVARAFLEPHTAMDDSFVERQLEKVSTNRTRGDNVPEDDYEFYDLTAWSLPLMNAVDAYWTESPVDLPADSVVVSEIASAGPAQELPEATAAYVIPSGTEAAQRAAFLLLSAGYRVATAVRPFRSGEREFPRGSFILRVERNPDDLRETVARHATALGLHPVALNTSFADSGITGIGSESTFSLEAPKVLVVAGEPTIPSSYGALRFLFEQTLGIEYVPVSVDALKRIELDKFNVVILPSGYPFRWGEALGESGKSSLKAWAEAGGTLICLGGAAEFAARSDSGWTSAKLVGSDDDESHNGVDENGEESMTEPLPVPGALLRAKLDHEHFLTFGYEAAEMAYLVNTDAFLLASETGTNVVSMAGEDLWLAGHIWPDNTEQLIAGTAAIVDEPVGDGHIILFSDEPGYRALWHATVRMLMNAILYGPGLQNQTGGYSH